MNKSQTVITGTPIKGNEENLWLVPGRVPGQPEGWYSIYAVNADMAASQVEDGAGDWEGEEFPSHLSDDYTALYCPYCAEEFIVPASTGPDEADYSEWTHESVYTYLVENHGHNCQEDVGGVILGNHVVDFDAAVNLMDDDLREQVHAELAPCTNQEFLDRYVVLHRKKYGKEFTVS